MKPELAVIGGDLRQVKMANSLAAENYHIRAYGFSDDIEFHEKIIKAVSVEQAVSSSNIVILPLPCTRDNKTVNMNLYNGKLYLSDLLDFMDKDTVILAGMVNQKVRDMISDYNIKLVDYFDREELAILNTIPTAEGAIQIAIEEMPITLHGSRCLVIGYGRVGKTLSKMLKGIGANVAVSARKLEDLAWIKSMNYECISFNQLNSYIRSFDCIFNTVPVVILDGEMLKRIDPNCLVIDLASKPGGVDFITAGLLGVRTIWALSLPGKVAPITAGEILKDTILNIIDELGFKNS